MADIIHFFAYGKLIDEDYFKEQGLEYVSKSSVTLSGWELVFNKIPIDNEGLEGLGLPNAQDPAGMRLKDRSWSCRPNSIESNISCPCENRSLR